MNTKSRTKPAKEKTRISGPIPEAPNSDFVEQVQQLNIWTSETASVGSISVSSLGSVLDAVQVPPRACSTVKHSRHGPVASSHFSQPARPTTATIGATESRSAPKTCTSTTKELTNATSTNASSKATAEQHRSTAKPSEPTTTSSVTRAEDKRRELVEERSFKSCTSPQIQLQIENERERSYASQRQTQRNEMTQFYLESSSGLATDELTKLQAGITRSDHTIVTYAINHEIKEIQVFGKKLQKMFQEGFDILSKSLAQKYQVIFLERTFENDSDEESGVAALYEIDKLITGKSPLGVNRLKDFRQKLKWSLMDNIEEDAPMLLTSKKESTQILQALQDAKLKELTASKTWDDVFKAVPEMRKVGNVIVCNHCPTKKGLTESSKDTLSSMKGKIRTHLTAKDHIKAIGISDYVPPEQSRGKVKNVESLLAEYPTFAVSEDEASIYCEPCQTMKKGCYKLAAGQQTYGQPLSTLKKLIKVHLETPSHVAAATGTASVLDHQAGMIAARNVLSSVWSGKGYQDYEKRMAADAAKDSTVGEINHSSAFASSLTAHMAAATLEAFKAQVHEPLPGTGILPHASITGDKGTINNTTYHVIAQVMPHDGELRSYVTDIVKSTDGRGEALAIEHKQALKQFYNEEEVKDVLSGGCFDGAMFHCHVPEHLMDMLDIPAEKRECLTFIHDPAHRLELAAKDSREQPKCLDTIGVPWLKENFDVHSTISAKFRKSGKSMEALRCLRTALRNSGEDVGTLKKFQTTSATRFAAHLVRSHSATYDNYQVLFKYFENSKDPEIQPLLTASFCARMCVLKDVYTLVGNASVELQKVHTTPWKKSRTMHQLAEDLKSMEVAFGSEVFRPTNPQLQCFNECSSEMLAYNSFKGQPVRGIARCRTRGQASSTKLATASEVLSAARKDAMDYVKSFRSCLQLRTKAEEDKPGWRIVDIASKVLSFEAVEEDISAEDVTDLYGLATDSGILTGCNLENFVEEHQKFVEETKAAREVNEELEEATFLVKRLTDGGSTTPHLNRVVSAVISKNTVETVCESVFSRMKVILEGRPNLSVENLKNEIVLWHQGPNPNSAAESDPLMKEALNRQFKGTHWHFHRTSGGVHNLKNRKVSQVVDRELTPKGKIDFGIFSKTN